MHPLARMCTAHTGRIILQSQWKLHRDPDPSEHSEACLSDCACEFAALDYVELKLCGISNSHALCLPICTGSVVFCSCQPNLHFSRWRAVRHSNPGRATQGDTCMAPPRSVRTVKAPHGLSKEHWGQGYMAWPCPDRTVGSAMVPVLE